jgi:tRNA (cytidine32/uridine32-2'-O)-methyltransferase
LGHLLEIDQSTNQAAILFGRENSGLNNFEIQTCGAQIRIPANDDYSSLNLAAAVQIISYELRMLALQPHPSRQSSDNTKLLPADKRRANASFAQREGHLEHLRETLEQLEFIKSKPPVVLMRKLTRLYNKANLSIEEVQILRGILTAIQTQAVRSE